MYLFGGSYITVKVGLEVQVNVRMWLCLVLVLKTPQLASVAVDHAASAHCEIIHNLHPAQQTETQEQACDASKRNYHDKYCLSIMLQDKEGLVFKNINKTRIFFL